MVMAYYIVTRKVGSTHLFGAPSIEVDFFPTESALEEAMYGIMETSSFAVDRSVSAFSQWDTAEEFFDAEYHWGMQRIQETHR